MADNFFFDAADEPEHTNENLQSQTNNHNEASLHFSQFKKWKFFDSTDDEEEFVPDNVPPAGIRNNN